MWDHPTEDGISTAAKGGNDIPAKNGIRDQDRTTGDNAHQDTVIIPFKEKERADGLEEIKAKPVYEFFKRFFDILFSAVASIILLIPIMFFALLIMIKDPGNPFYVHTRIGKDHKPIKLLKLRSMKIGADKLENMLTPEQLEEYKREYKLRDDPRLIGWEKPGDGSRCFGAKIRQWSIDELVQIPYNVLIKNDLRLVGPRPILEEELRRYYTPEQQELLLSVKPGLTGYWQAFARNDAMYEDGRRQEMELYYVRNRSLWLDIKIIFATVAAVVKKSGV